MIDEEKLCELFSYHTPNEQRSLKHKAANEAASLYAMAIARLVKNPSELTTIVRKILDVRHAVNQAITYDAENLTIRDIFEVSQILGIEHTVAVDQQQNEGDNKH